jgi:hypothetical protein
VPVKLQGKMPDPDRNGLADLATRLAEDSSDELLVVATVAVHSVETIVDSDGDVIVKLRLLDVEPIEGDERGFIEAVARSKREQRTGRRSLPGFGTVFDPDAADRRGFRPRGGGAGDAPGARGPDHG